MPKQKPSIDPQIASTADTPFSASFILSELPSAVMVIARSEHLAYLNPAAEALLGASHQALIGKELSRFVFPYTQLQKLIHLAFETGQAVRDYELPLSSPRGSSERRIQVQVSPLRTEPHQPIAHVIVQMDLAGVTPQGSLTRTTREAINPLSGMAAILAHEVKNPLSGIRGAAQLLEKHVSEAQHKLTHLIRDEVDRITALLNEMEIFSNDAPIKTAAVNIHEVLQYTKSISENGFARSIAFQEIYDPSLPLVEANRDLLVQVFLNLLKNAAEACCQTPSPVIRLITTYSGGVKFKPPTQDRPVSLPVAIWIEDNGPGIPETVRANLFTPFVSSKEGGKGLGLAIVSKIISDHGGTIEVEHTASGHTRFKILLPAAKE